MSFLDDLAMQKWIAGNGTRLWCTGIPGSGKTTAAAALVERLRATSTWQPNSDINVAAVFCDYKMKEVLSIPNIMAGVWMQVAAFSDLSKEAIELYKRLNA